MQWITSQRIEREYSLPRALATDIVVAQLQAALRYSWPCWAWLACWTVPLLACWFGWLPWDFGGYEHSARVWLLIVVGCGWVGMARWLAGPAIMAAAASKMRSLHRISQEFDAT